MTLCLFFSFLVCVRFCLFLSLPLALSMSLSVRGRDERGPAEKIGFMEFYRIQIGLDWPKMAPRPFCVPTLRVFSERKKTQV